MPSTKRFQPFFAQTLFESISRGSAILVATISPLLHPHLLFISHPPMNTLSTFVTQMAYGSQHPVTENIRFQWPFVNLTCYVYYPPSLYTFKWKPCLRLELFYFHSLFLTYIYLFLTIMLFLSRCNDYSPWPALIVVGIIMNIYYKARIFMEIECFVLKHL